MCFYDGSHVARAGSDVNWFLFEVLPRLKPGVMVHVHDIYWPDDYHDQWVYGDGLSWNEQYVLQAFLMHNSAYRVRLANHMCSAPARPTSARSIPAGPTAAASGSRRPAARRLSARGTPLQRAR